MIVFIILCIPYVILFILRVIYKLTLGTIKRTIRIFRGKVRKIDQLKIQMHNAKTYEEWKQLANEYDERTNIPEWKQREKSSLYDYKYIREQMTILRESRASDNFHKIMAWIRSHAHRNIAGILTPSLYFHNYVGTKKLIEDFQEELIICLEYIANVPKNQLSWIKKMEFFSELRHAFGKTALVLSGGSTIAMYHYGVMRALYDQGMLPRIISGSSGGSLLASIVCCKTTEELKELFADPRTGVKMGVWERPEYQFSWPERFRRLYRGKSMLTYETFRDFIKDNCGDLTFREAYDRTGMILNITVTGQNVHDGNIVLNYLSAPNVVIWSAVCCSSAIPLVLGPVDLYCKDPNGKIIPYYYNGSRRFIDGSVGADLPTQTLSELFNVNTFIVSQCEPWIYPWLSTSELDRTLNKSCLKRIYEKVLKFVSLEIKCRLAQLDMLGIVPKSYSRYLNLVTQRYRGDITIWPTLRLRDLTEILTYPYVDKLEFAFYEGARRTYPKLNYIAAMLLIEKTIEKNFLYLEAKQLMKSKVLNRNGEPISRESSSVEPSEIEEEQNEDYLSSPSKSPVKKSMHRQLSLYTEEERKKLNSFKSPRSFAPVELFSRMRNTQNKLNSMRAMQYFKMEDVLDIEDLSQEAKTSPSGSGMNGNSIIHRKNTNKKKKN